MTVLGDIHTQLFTRPPYPTADFSGKTIIVTGSNVGLGKEAVRHFVRLKAAKVIIAVRSVAKGEAAKADLEKEYKRATEVVEVWKLDYASYASCKAFARLAAQLDRLDAVVLNAGIATEQFEILEDNESQVTVNVVSTILLVLLLLPTLRASATKYPGMVPVISVVSSGVHAYTKFPERKTPNSLDTLNFQKTAVMSDRYQATKLLQLFAIREIAEKTVNKKPFITINAVDPGLCYPDLTRIAVGFTYYAMKVMRALLAWTAEEGGRNLVFATIAGPESHGVYITGCKIQNKGLSKFVKSSEGEKTQKKVWAELAEKLEKIQPGTTSQL